MKSISKLFVLTRLISSGLNQSIFENHPSCKDWISSQKDD